MVSMALEYIYNKNRLIAKLQERMEEYAADFRFEEAMILRDRIKTIEKSQVKTGMDFASNENLDIFAIKQGLKRAVVVRMFIRDGKLASSNHDYIKLDFIDEQSVLDLDEMYERAIINYYNHEIPVLPKEVIIASDIENQEELQRFLYERLGKKIALTFPKVGKKREIINVALNNCEELLRIDASKNKITVYRELQTLFGLQRLPLRIESFDNSHLMGQACVGAMVVWEEKFIKENFRHYNLDANDEYAQMREMLMRRVENFENNPAPDLWVIDGGLTLLKLAYDIVESVGVNIDIIAIAKEKIDAKAHRAKGKAKDILHYKYESEFKELRLQSSDARLQFIQRLRDEAHRFVINFHKKQKRKEDKQISLLQLHGIGEAKVKKLLLYFGTFEEIKQATLANLKEVLNEKDAIVISEHFKSLE
jgi:excinuclease ABC subunit C